MFIDDCPYLENNSGGDNMNMRPMPYMAWGNSPMYNPYMDNMNSCVDNIDYNNMNRGCNNITNEYDDAMYTINASPTGTNQPSTTPPPSTVPSIENDNLYTQGFLRNQIGKRVKIEFLIGTNMLMDREGTLVDVGISYVLIREVDTNDLVMADMYSIKFVRIFD